MLSILAFLSFQVIVVSSQQLPEHFGGKVDDRYRHVQQAFIENFRRGLDTEGAAFVAYENSRLVVDLWGGYADKESARKWREDTMSVAFSSTKAVLAIVIALLNSRGQLNYTDTVASHWPEFAKNGKDNITIDMVMNHRAGLVYLDQGIQVQDVEDHNRMALLFENARPNYPPGTMTVYHEFTFGWLVDQIVRRVDAQQRGVAEFLQDEIIRPNGISFYIGLPIELEGKVARSKLANNGVAAAFTNISSILRGMLSPQVNYEQRSRQQLAWLFPSNGINLFNNPEVLSMEIPAANGVGTARGLASIFAFALDGRLGISREVLGKITVPEFQNVNDMFSPGWTSNTGWGFRFTKNPNGGWLFGHEGYGGQYVKGDPETGLAFAYLTNSLKISSSDEGVRAFQNLQNALYQSYASSTTNTSRGNTTNTLIFTTSQPFVEK